MFYRFLTDEEGATAIEYALIASLISIGIVSGLQALAEAQQQNTDTIDQAMQGAFGP